MGDKYPQNVIEAGKAIQNPYKDLYCEGLNKEPNRVQENPTTLTGLHHVFAIFSCAYPTPSTY